MRGLHVILSGCSGGGKSTLLAELAFRGVPTFIEPGREVVRQALAGQGGALPDRDPDGFAAACLRRGLDDLRSAEALGASAVFDRSPVDVLSWVELRALRLPPGLAAAAEAALARFHRMVVFAPPWPDIYVQDDERRHSFEKAVEDHDRLRRDYLARGHLLLDLPRAPPQARADWFLANHPAFAG